MTINVHLVASAAEAFTLLEQLSNNNVRFRGQRDANWRLESTLSRHYIAAPSSAMTLQLHSMINHFVVNLASIGIQLPFDRTDLRARLEFARHYGVPSPLIDFSLSPYVALFFAFNGTRPSQAKADDNAAVYCLNILQLANVWAKTGSTDIHGNIDGAEYAEKVNAFRYDSRGKLERDYPIDVLDYLEMPAIWNRRMQRQLGVFLYDTLNYGLHNCSNLENFLERKEVTGPDSSV
jgi:hypothetical protein